MALYAIGDVHGCVDALKNIFRHHHFSRKDQIIFLGDYVDRGSDVKGTINFLLQIKRQFNCIFLKGNHEIMMMNAARRSAEFDFWHRNGGKATLASYGTSKNENWQQHLPESHWHFIQETIPYFESKSIIFVHAGLTPQIPLSLQLDKIIYWQKIEDVPQKYADGKTVVCGHTAQRSGRIANWSHTICIDTYAYGNQWLTCLDCSKLSFVQSSNDGRVRTGQLSNVM